MHGATYGRAASIRTAPSCWCGTPKRSTGSAARKGENDDEAGTRCGRREASDGALAQPCAERYARRAVEGKGRADGGRRDCGGQADSGATRMGGDLLHRGPDRLPEIYRRAAGAESGRQGQSDRITAAAASLRGCADAGRVGDLRADALHAAGLSEAQAVYRGANHWRGGAGGDASNRDREPLGEAQRSRAKKSATCAQRAERAIKEWESGKEQDT